MKTKIHPGVHQTETENSYTVESNFRNGFTRKRNSKRVKKTGDIRKDLSALEKAKASVISHYEEMEYKSAVGIITKDTEYTIRGMNFVGGRQGNDKERIEIKIAVQRRGAAAFCRSVSTYARFSEIWHEATDLLVAFHRLKSKPQEWVEAPSELYFERLQAQLIGHKRRMQINKHTALA